MCLNFFKLYLEHDVVQWASLPLKPREQKAFGVWLCRQNGPVPGDFLQVGMAILRRLDLDQLPDGEIPPFWPFVGFLEWVRCCSPDKEVFGPILEDLGRMYPRSPHGTAVLYERIQAKHPDLALPIMRVKV